jgi:hypothetical protein
MLKALKLSQNQNPRGVRRFEIFPKPKTRQ